MAIEATSAMGAARPWHSALLLVLLTLTSCAAPVRQASAPPPPPPKEALPFEEAVDQLTIALFARATLAPSEFAGRTLVIDPLIDRTTGNQAAATQSMEQRITSLVRTRFSRIEPRPFTAESLDARPLILVGSITPVEGPGVIPSTTAPSNTYRIWAALADLRTNRVISHETAWVRADGVDMTPTAFFQDSPSWLADTTQAAYIRVCASDPGAVIDPVYINGLYAAAAIAEGVKAYEAGRYGDALTVYSRARSLPAGDQLRVYNGLYLVNAALGRTADAEAAFGSMVDYGLQRGKLAVKFVFSPNSTRFWPDRAVSGPYPMWLHQIARQTAKHPACLRLVGHTSPTGSPQRNQALSVARAAYVRTQLTAREREIATRIVAEGRGSAEPLVGSGRDDATDVLDRRVEFESRPCLNASVDAPRPG